MIDLDYFLRLILVLSYELRISHEFRFPPLPITLRWGFHLGVYTLDFKLPKIQSLVVMNLGHPSDFYKNYSIHLKTIPRVFAHCGGKLLKISLLLRSPLLPLELKSLPFDLQHHDPFDIPSIMNYKLKPNLIS